MDGPFGEPRESFSFHKDKTISALWFDPSFPYFAVLAYSSFALICISSYGCFDYSLFVVQWIVWKCICEENALIWLFSLKLALVISTFEHQAFVLTITPRNIRRKCSELELFFDMCQLVKRANWLNLRVLTRYDRLKGKLNHQKQLQNTWCIFNIYFWSFLEEDNIDLLVICDTLFSQKRDIWCCPNLALHAIILRRGILLAFVLVLHCSSRIGYTIAHDFGKGNNVNVSIRENSLLSMSWANVQKSMY